MHFDKAAVNRILPEVLAFLMVILIIFAYKSSSAWGIFVWVLCVPFILLEWKLGHIRPSLVINRNILLGFFLFSLLTVLAGAFLSDWGSVRKGFHYVLCAIPFFLVIYFDQHYQIRRGMALGLLVSVAGLCGYGLYQWHLAPAMRMQSIYNEANGFGISLELLIPFAVALGITIRKNSIRIATIVLILISCACLYLTGSRGSVLSLSGGFFCGAVTLLVVYHRRLTFKQKVIAGAVCVLILALGAGAGLAVNASRGHATGGERLIMLESSYHMWEDHKLAGVGQGHWAENYYGSYRPAGQKEQGLNMPHNMIVYYLSTTGVIGTAGYFLYIVLTLSGLYQILRKRKQLDYICIAGLIVFWSFQIHGLVDGTFNDAKAAKLYFLMLGWAVSEASFYADKGDQVKGERA